MSETDSLAIELGEGFAGDDVDVLVDGKRVWHGEGVTTNYSVGIADVVRVPAPTSAEATVEVRVGRRTSAQQVEPKAASGEIRLRARIDPAGALALGAAPEGPVF